MLSKLFTPDPEVVERVVETLGRVLGHVPSTVEPLSTNPEERAKQLTTRAALKSAAIAGGLSLPPGPLGLLTILPDLATIWTLQQKLVADIAAAYGKQAFLGQEQMLYCLFRHTASQGVRDLVVRVGGRLLVRRATLRAFQKALRAVGVKVTQRIIGKALARWVPLIGAAGVGVYAYYDTRHVGQTASEFFSEELDYET